MRRALLVVLLLGLAAPASASAAMTDLQIADAAWPGHPCTGQVQIVMDPAIVGRGGIEEATGRLFYPDGSSVLVSCVVTIDPAWWAEATRYARCLVVVHAVGHLAGHQHEPSGVMAAQPTGHAPCDVRRPMLRRVMAALHERHHANVTCGAWQRDVLRCEVDKGRRVLRYRARRFGETFVLVRLKDRRVANQGSLRPAPCSSCLRRRRGSARWSQR